MTYLALLLLLLNIGRAAGVEDWSRTVRELAEDELVLQRWRRLRRHHACALAGTGNGRGIIPSFRRGVLLGLECAGSARHSAGAGLRG